MTTREIFSEVEVGGLLKLIIICYENDGRSFEQLTYQSLGMTPESNMVIGAGFLEMYKPMVQSHHLKHAEGFLLIRRPGEMSLISTMPSAICLITAVKNYCL